MTENLSARKEYVNPKKYKMQRVFIFKLMNHYLI